MRRVPSSIVLALAVMMLVGGQGASAGHRRPPPPNVDVQLLAFNDFHGQLEALPPASTSGARIGGLTAGQCVAPTCVPAGGVEYLATHLRDKVAANPNSLIVSAGDNIGATPLLSALFHDEPTIEALSKSGLALSSVGNHEFDEGVTELYRMQFGRCHPVDGCADGDGFAGADFKYLAANVVSKKWGLPILPPFAIRNFGGVNVGFIGMTLEGTPLIVSPGGIQNVKFLDEAATANFYVKLLKFLGVQTIVVLLHEGGAQSVGLSPASINTCTGMSGAITDIVNRTNDAVDLFITGHTHNAYNCMLPNAAGRLVPVSSATSQGRLLTDIDMTISGATRNPVSISVNNEIVTRDVAPAADMTALIAKYNVFAGPIAAQVVGHITGPLTRTSINTGGEQTMGRLIADAQLASTLGVGGQIAFMNPGGIRADLNFTGAVTHGQAFAVQPFSNIVTTKTFTGAQIKAILEQQFKTSAGGTRTLILPVSAGFTYSWSASAAVDNKVSNMMLNAVPIGMATTYRVTANNFLAGGGDDFPGFAAVTAFDTGLDDLVALEQYLGAHDPYSPVLAPDRITQIP
ncbi:MAG: bifunctional metallophosphatase/5'-nucleotidase [Mycobacterium sp.]